MFAGISGVADVDLDELGDGVAREVDTDLEAPTEKEEAGKSFGQVFEFVAAFTCDRDLLIAVCTAHLHASIHQKASDNGRLIGTGQGFEFGA